MAKILIVDDEPHILSALARFFERSGHDVLCAATGEEAVGIVQAEHPAVVLLDLLLPDVSGFDVLERTPSFMTRISFRDRPIQPLSHLSKTMVSSSLEVRTQPLIRP